MANLTRTQQLLHEQLPEISFKFNYRLADQAFFKIGGLAEVYVTLGEASQVSQLVQVCTRSKIRITVLGGGSNVLVADQGVTGVVLRLTNNQVELIEKSGLQILKVGAGCKTSLAVKQSVELGLTGLEPFLGVPGTIGGAIYNNAHYQQQLIGERVTRVQVVDDQGQLKWLSQAECRFGYDISRFHQTREIIWLVELGLTKGNQAESLQIMKQSTIHRAVTQPLGEPSSGCIFQNVPNTAGLKKLFPQFAGQSHISAGFIIDQAGLKGESVGDIQVSPKHAAFFVNQGQGTSRDVLELVRRVKEQVKARFGVNLREEIFYLGQHK